jgi:hypothetical protein
VSRRRRSSAAVAARIARSAAKRSRSELRSASGSATRLQNLGTMQGGCLPCGMRHAGETEAADGHEKGRASASPNITQGGPDGAAVLPAALQVTVTAAPPAAASQSGQKSSTSNAAMPGSAPARRAAVGQGRFASAPPLPVRSPTAAPRQSFTVSLLNPRRRAALLLGGSGTTYDAAAGASFAPRDPAHNAIEAGSCWCTHRRRARAAEGTRGAQLPASAGGEPASSPSLNPRSAADCAPCRARPAASAGVRAETPDSRTRGPAYTPCAPRPVEASRSASPSPAPSAGRPTTGHDPQGPSAPRARCVRGACLLVQRGLRSARVARLARHQLLHDLPVQARQRGLQRQHLRRGAHAVNNTR